MNRIGYVLFYSLIFTLSSCGPLPQFNAEMQKQADTERQATLSTHSRIAAQCKYIDKIPPRHEAIASFECQDKIVRESYLPSAAAPDLLIGFSAKYREMIVNYAEGHISAERLKVDYGILEAEYAQQLSQRYSVAQSQAMQQQTVFAGQLNALGQSLQGSSSAGQCSSIDIDPMASLGCKNVCINGRWAEVC